MSSFFYKARDAKGLAISGIIDAESEAAIVANLNNLGYQVVRVDKQNSFTNHFFGIFKKWQKIPLREIILFTRQLSVMLRSGLPITTALSSISQQVKNEELQNTTKELLKDIQSGQSLSEALSKYPKIFNELFINMVKVGETAGMLDQVLDRLVILKTQEYEVRTRVQSALVYPVILVVAAIAIVSFLLISIIPKFVVVFETYETKIPFATQFLLSLSGFISKFWYLMILIIFALVFWFKRYIKKQENRYNFHNFLLKIPILGELLLKLIIARFTRTLSVLIKSGVTILEALKIAGNTVDNVFIAQIIKNIRQAVSIGHSLSKQIEISGVFPPMVVQMISAGEKSGKLDQMLADIAVYYEQEIDYALKNLTTILEPLLLLTMGGVVAFIAMSVLLPIFNLIKVFRGGI